MPALGQQVVIGNLGRVDPAIKSGIAVLTNRGMQRTGKVICPATYGFWYVQHPDRTLAVYSTEELGEENYSG